MIAWLAGLTLASAALQPAPAHSRMDYSPSESLSGLYNYGYCVFRLEPSQSRRLLTTAPGSAAEQSVLRLIASDRCLNGGGAINYLTASPQLLRGVLAEAVVDIDVVRRGWERARPLRQPFSDLSPTDLESLTPAGRAALRGLDLAQCIQAAAPTDTASLLNTRAESVDERRAFEALAVHFAPCFPAGASATLSRPMLRGLLAEATYRAAFAARSVAR